MSFASAPAKHLPLQMLSSQNADWYPITAGTAASTAWPAASIAIFQPFSISIPVTVYEGWVYTGTLTTSNNMRIGIYDTAGTQLLTSADVAVAVASAIVVMPLTDTVIPAGSYYMALSCDGTRNIAAQTQVSGVHQACGVMEQTGLTGAALPSPATFAVFTRAFHPLFGLTLRNLSP